MYDSEKGAVLNCSARPGSGCYDGSQNNAANGVSVEAAVAAVKQGTGRKRTGKKQ